MKKLVGNSDLGIPYTTVLNRAIVKLVQSMFGINKINHLYAEASTKEGVEFAQAVLDQLEVSIAGEPRLDVIPRKGAFVLVSNHPYGALDGLILMVLVSIFISFFIDPVTILISGHTLPTVWRYLVRLLLIPLVVGLGYELIKYAGRHSNLLTRIVSAPGMWLQHLTVFEPTDDMIECAIAAVTPVIPEDGSDRW